MEMEFDNLLEVYADLTLKVGLNLQEGQRLKIGNFNGAVPGILPFEAAPLVRKITKKAYQMGAPLVEVFWGDEQLNHLRYMHAPRDTFQEFPSWVVGEIESSVKRGDAHLIIIGNNPYLMRDVDPELIAIFQQTRARELAQVFELSDQNPSNWLVIAYATQAWAATVFPTLPISDAVSILWENIVKFCRLDSPDPISFWKAHNRELLSRGRWLTQAKFKLLHLKGSDTDLTVDLPKGHIWQGGSTTLPNGIKYCANIPTEEVFTLPDRKGVNGHVLATKPFTTGGMYIEGMRLAFENGKVVNASATEGEDVLMKALEMDEGACRLGEIALVPHSSPISQSQIIFNNVLYDENASVHLALGNAYRDCLTNGEKMDKDDFIAAGGNFSVSHRDFMIGSADMDIDGFTQDGSSQPLMRGGEWAFEVE
jgi:aminopeptidase